jgi:hypothetical protein
VGICPLAQCFLLNCCYNQNQVTYPKYLSLSGDCIKRKIEKCFEVFGFVILASVCITDCSYIFCSELWIVVVNLFCYLLPIKGDVDCACLVNSQNRPLLLSVCTLNQSFSQF